MINMEDITITVHYPTPENQQEYERRGARVYARILAKYLNDAEMEKLINLLEAENNKK